MNYSEMRIALDTAKQTLKNADYCANDLAKMLIGRLRKVNCNQLDQLKRELKDYNMKTGHWK